MPGLPRLECGAGSRSASRVRGWRIPVSGLLEREAEMALLLGRYAQAANGQGGTVLLSGEAGMGKTSVIEHFAAALRGGPVPPSAFLVGRCDDMHTPTPLGPIHDLALLAPDPARGVLLAARDAGTAAAALVDLARALTSTAAQSASSTRPPRRPSCSAAELVAQ